MLVVGLTAGAQNMAVLSSNPMATNQIIIYPERPRQVIKGLGFEIQSDSIGSGNSSLPESSVSVPHDLNPSEQQRFYQEMLRGIRYCRLAGGLYWRGVDAAGRQLQPRWPGQLKEIHEMLATAGVEGVSFEYWSPAPFWKANQSFVGQGGDDRFNTLRCFGPNFDRDPVYHGDVDRFLADFAKAVVGDIETLESAGIKVSMWGLQNEPFASGGGYSKCVYFTAADYVKTYSVVAAEVRKHNPEIQLIADTESGFPAKIATAMRDPAVAPFVDDYVVHTVGSPAEEVARVNARIRRELPPRPWFQNEYEYLNGGATPDRCLNTVQHIMNSFQQAENPTWFWIHALKPYQNAEASGYALGFWKSREELSVQDGADQFRRWNGGPQLADLPAEFKTMEMITATRGATNKPGAGYSFIINQPATLYLLVHNHGNYVPQNWSPTAYSIHWDDQSDTVYSRLVPAGEIRISAHTGEIAGEYGVPDVTFIQPSDPKKFKVMMGMNVPIAIRSDSLARQKQMAGLPPGSWIYNPCNWNAVGSFVKRMTWDSVALTVEEKQDDPNARILVFKKPDGRLTVVLSNRTGKPYAFQVKTGSAAGVWKGYRYTPSNSGERTMGIQIGSQSGNNLNFMLEPLSWEFWEQE